jgi:hypothetical protein
MKIKHLLIMSTSFGILLLFNSCVTKKLSNTSAGSGNSSVEILTLPFSGSEYHSDNECFRERASGKSKYDLETASSEAVLIANGKIATDLEVLIKNVSESITNKLQINEKEEFSKELNSRLVAVTKQYLKGTRTIAEKALKDSDGSITYWVVRELSMKPIIEEVANTISKDQKINQKLKKEETTKMANDELEKMENEKKK